MVKEQKPRTKEEVAAQGAGDPQVFQEAERWSKRTSMPHAGTWATIIALGAIGIAANIGVRYTAHKLERDLDVMPRVTRVIGQDKSKEGLGKFLKAIEINYQVHDGDTLDPRSQYRDPIEISIYTSNNQRILLGTTTLDKLNSYIEENSRKGSYPKE